MAKNYEIEIKSLLGSKENAETLKNNLKKYFPDTKLIGKGKQLNHYFNLPNSLDDLKSKVKEFIPKEKIEELEHVLCHGQKMSLRTRDADGKVILVVKASVGDGSSSNGVKRIEFESVVPMTLAELDKALLDAGATYQAKWSREREEYQSGDMQVCIDKNAGYGYLAEFEKVTQDEGSLDAVKHDLLDVMKKLDVVELAQDRLERMFAHYNAHWSEYYGTENTFIID